MSSAAAGRAIGLSALNAASKLLAIGKTMLVAALFGAGASLDAFWVAYSLPLLLPGLLTTVVTVAFVPRFMAHLEGRDGPDAWRGANTLFTVLLSIAVVASIAMYVFASALIEHLAPGLAPATHAEAVALTRILLPCVPLLTLSSLLSAISNARERFVLPAMEGVLTNITVVLAALLLAREWGITALVVGVLAGFVLQAGVLLWGNREDLRRNLRPAFAPRHPDFTGPLGHFVPLLVGSAGAMATGLINQFYLSHGGEGAISAMAYAVMFAFLPVEVFAQAVITTVYPSFSRHFARGEHAAAATAFGEGLRLVLFLTVPCAVMLVVLAEPMMALLLERGAFGPAQTAMTGTLTSIMALGLVARSVAYLGYRVLHASLHPWRQVLIGLAGVGTHVLLCRLWADTHGAHGVAWAATLSMAQSALLSLLSAFHVLRWQRPSGLGRDLLVLGLVAVTMALPVALLAPLAWPPDAGARLPAALATLAIGLGAGLLGLLCAKLLRQPDLDALSRQGVAWIRRRSSRPPAGDVP